MRLRVAFTADYTRTRRVGRWETLFDKPRLELDKPALVVRNNSAAMRVASRTSVKRKGEPRCAVGWRLVRLDEDDDIEGSCVSIGLKSTGRLCRHAERSETRVIPDNNA